MNSSLQKPRKLLMLSPNFQLDPNWNELPCQPCPLLDRCGLGNEISPITCKLMNDWLGSLLRDKKNGGI